MRVIGLQFLFILNTGSTVAQYDLGLSAGAFTQSFKRGWFSDGPWSWSASLHYRERVGSHTDLGFDLNGMYARFSGSWWNGSLGSSRTMNADHVELLFLQISPYLDVRMDPNARAVFRFGPQLGIKLSERLSGSRSVRTISSPATHEVFDHERTDFFQPLDLRMMVGLGFTLGSEWKNMLILDPYFSYGITALLKTNYYVEKSAMIGIQIGIARRLDRKPFTKLFREGAPERPADEG